MTTTLRPSGPEERPDGDDGERPRRRAYDICVNGRRAGGVQVSAADERGVRTGRIAALEVDEADRRKGRATVAALAAEEVLRGWDCRRSVVSVPAGAGPALRLATALGYTERSRQLLKTVDAPGAAPGPREDDGDGEESGLRPMTGEHYRAWLVRDRAQLVALMTADGVRPERAAEEAYRAQRALLPGGPATPGMAFHRLLHRGASVGTLWLRLDGAPLPGADAWVYAVEVAGQYRGRGHGRRLMRAAERLCHEAGRQVLGLNVYAGNTPARALYESLGYRPAEYLLGKPLL